MEVNQPLKKARRQYRAALKELNNITKSQIQGIKKIRKPPTSLQAMLSHLMFLLGAEKVKKWSHIKKCLDSPEELLERIYELKPSDVPKNILHILFAAIYNSRGVWEPEVMIEVNLTGARLANWMLAFCRLAKLKRIAQAKQK